MLHLCHTTARFGGIRGTRGLAGERLEADEDRHAPVATQRSCQSTRPDLSQDHSWRSQRLLGLLRQLVQSFLHALALETFEASLALYVQEALRLGEGVRHAVWETSIKCTTTRTAYT